MPKSVLSVALVDLPTPDAAVFVTAARTVLLVDRRLTATRVRTLAQVAGLLAQLARPGVSAGGR